MDVIFIELGCPRRLFIAFRVNELKYSDAYHIVEARGGDASYYIDELEKYGIFKELKKEDLPINNHLEHNFEWKTRYEKDFVRAWAYK